MLAYAPILEIIFIVKFLGTADIYKQISNKYFDGQKGQIAGNWKPAGRLTAYGYTIYTFILTIY